MRFCAVDCAPVTWACVSSSALAPDGSTDAPPASCFSRSSWALTAFVVACAPCEEISPRSSASSLAENPNWLGRFVELAETRL